MPPRREGKRRNYPSSSPPRDHQSQPSRRRPLSPPSAAVIDRPTFTADESILFGDLHITADEVSNYSNNPRSFPYSVKQQCWEKAEKIKGRDPDRWRRDPLGNTIFRKLVGCPGCLCHDYDHIIPYSKGGQSTLENCQVLQLYAVQKAEFFQVWSHLVSSDENEATVNRSKGNRTEMSRADLIQKSSYCRVTGRDMDLLELSAYGNVRRGQDPRGCSIQ